MFVYPVIAPQGIAPIWERGRDVELAASLLAKSADMIAASSSPLAAQAPSIRVADSGNGEPTDRNAVTASVAVASRNASSETTCSLDMKNL